jgi:hypothetical protein
MSLSKSTRIFFFAEPGIRSHLYFWERSHRRGALMNPSRLYSRAIERENRSAANLGLFLLRRSHPDYTLEYLGHYMHALQIAGRIYERVLCLA